MRQRLESWSLTACKRLNLGNLSFSTFVNIFCEVDITSSLDVVMDFAKVYRAEITLAYYCFNLSLTIAIFIFGTIYLRHRDRRDQQRKDWRKFAETIRGQYSTLKDKQVLSGVSKLTRQAVLRAVLLAVLGWLLLDVSGLEPFNPKGEAHNLSQRWKKWKRAFSLYSTFFLYILTTPFGNSNFFVKHFGDINAESVFGSRLQWGKLFVKAFKVLWRPQWYVVWQHSNINFVSVKFKPRTAPIVWIRRKIPVTVLAFVQRPVQARPFSTSCHGDRIIEDRITRNWRQNLFTVEANIQSSRIGLSVERRPKINPFVLTFAERDSQLFLSVLFSVIVYVNMFDVHSCKLVTSVPRAEDFSWSAL